jgi:hypothetical protein
MPPRLRKARAAQRLLPFAARTQRLDRRFKRAIAAATALVLVGAIVGSPELRYQINSLAARLKTIARQPLGLEPSREEIEADRRSQRASDVARSTAAYREAFAKLDAGYQHLMKAAGMGPDDALIRWGNYDHVLMFSSTVFEPDEAGRSYRMRPSMPAIWLQHVTFNSGGALPVVLVADRPEIRQAATTAHATVLTGLMQTTNSWGCRGPEPDPDALYRVLVLGDSFMQGMLVGDDDTPPVRLERFLTRECKAAVSVLNTGHLGYSPEQYYFTLLEYGERFRPQVVVVSTCANDFGDRTAALHGEGAWEENGYWLGQIQRYCDARNLVCLLTTIPDEYQVIGRRNSGFFQGEVLKIFPYSSLHYVDPTDDFVNQHLQLTRARAERGERSYKCPLYNGEIGDSHFSPLGAEVWAQAIGRRITLLVKPPSPGLSRAERPVNEAARAK